MSMTAASEVARLRADFNGPFMSAGVLWAGAARARAAAGPPSSGSEPRILTLLHRRDGLHLGRHLNRATSRPYDSEPVP